MRHYLNEAEHQDVEVFEEVFEEFINLLEGQLKGCTVTA